MSRLSTNMHPLLTEIILDTLFDKHIYTTLNFIETDIKKLCSITKYTYKNILTIRKHIINKNSATNRNSYDYYKEIVSKSSILPTGIIKIDECLEGGVSTGNIYELCGLPGSGKTQFCLTLAKNIVKHLSRRVYFLDAKRNFSSKRLKRMCEADQLSKEKINEIFSKILIKNISDPYELINALHAIKDEIKNGLIVKLIIIDSLPALLYQYGSSAEYNVVLNHIVNVIRFMSVELHICIIVTNVYTTWYEEWTSEVQSQSNVTEKIGCGKYWTNVPNLRLQISKLNHSNEYEISLNGYFTSSKKCTVTIGDKGMY